MKHWIKGAALGLALSVAVAAPALAQKTTVTTFRSSRAGASTTSAAPQNGQNGNSPGNSRAQLGQVLTEKAYDRR